MVGTTLANKLLQLGHEVTLGSRTEASEPGRAWLSACGSDKANIGTFAMAASGAEVVFNATKGEVSLAVLEAAGEENLSGKILVDISNPLDFSQGMPPRLLVCNDSSLGEQIQERFPRAKVIKTLNTVSAPIMVAPGSLPSATLMFVAGDDLEAKQWVEQTLLREWFGWEQVTDLGGISASRGTEMFLPLWVRMWGALKTPLFNLALVRGD